MLALEVALLRLTMGYHYVGLAITVLALIGCIPRLQRAWRFGARAAAMGAVAAACYLLVQMDVFGLDPLRSTVVEDPGSLAGALCFMMLQAMQYYWRTPRGLPQYYPLLGVIALAFSADRYLGEPQDTAFAFACAMVYGVLMALFYAAEVEARDLRRDRWRGQRYAAIGLCLLLSFALAGGTAWALKNSDRAVAQWMANHALLERLGLDNSAQTRLDSISAIKSRDRDRIALQIEAENSPGYLRGQVYMNYESTTWTALPPGESAPEVKNPPEGYVALWRDSLLYTIQPGAARLDASMTVFPSPEIERALFIPMETGWLGRRGGLQVNRAGVAQSPGVLNGQPYQVLTALRPERTPLSAEEREQYTRLPAELAPRLQGLSDTICGVRTDTEAKASAIAQYFTGNYEYTLGIQVPEDEDPLAYFLFSDPLPAAHCEFFATGAGLLLRAAGVPARYVTGVGVWEQHPFADYWVARNRDAHAWVEAWDEEEGWFIVEATPASGLPEAGQGQRASVLGDLWSLIALHLRQFLAALRDGAWRVAVDALAALLAGLDQFVQEAWVPLVLALGLFVVLLRLVRIRKQRPARNLPQGEIARRMHRQLQTMDCFVRRRHRLERPAHVTPHAFAHELERAVVGEEDSMRIARWYRAWADVRYQPVTDPAAIDALEVQLKSLRRRTRA